MAANVWRRLPAPFKPMEPRFGAPVEGVISSISDFYGLPAEGTLDVGGITVALHVGRPRPFIPITTAITAPLQRLTTTSKVV